MEAIKPLLVVLISGFSIATADVGNCYLEGIGAVPWTYGFNNDDVNDTFSGIVKIFKTENVTGVRIGDATYLNAYMKDFEVYVYATDSFKYFERDSPRMFDPSVDVDILFSCTEGERELRFYQPIIDTNNNAPYFYQNEYVFRFAMAVPIDTKLTNFLTVKASDFDITNSNLQFAFEEEDATEYLSVEYRAYEYGDKVYSPVIKTTTALEKPFRRSFTLRANDSREPLLSSSTIITLLVIDPEDVVPSPGFNQSLTIANYDGSVLSLSESISLKEGQWSEYEISQKGLEEYISVGWSTESEGSVAVSLKKKIPAQEFSNGYVTMDIIARHDYAFHHGQTSLLIYLQ